MHEYLELVSTRLAHDLAHDFDDTLRAAITRHMGTEAWTLDSLRGRLSAVTVAGIDGETFCLDGHPLVRFFPTKIEFLGTTMYVTRPYLDFTAKGQKAGDNSTRAPLRKGLENTQLGDNCGAQAVEKVREPY